MPYQIEYYVECSGSMPFPEWLEALRDRQAKARIMQRLYRLELEHFGDCKPCHDGVWELRIDTGPGYRVYYAKSGRRLILLLCAGDKQSQAADIRRACDYWRNWQARQ